MGRGTDIKPETEAGLMVLRTYPALPQITKQELGRHGRNGANGTCIDIINYEDIKREFERFIHKDSPYKDRITQIMQEQKLHLEQNFAKHNEIQSTKWKWLEEGREENHSDRNELQER